MNAQLAIAYKRRIDAALLPPEETDLLRCFMDLRLAMLAGDHEAVKRHEARADRLLNEYVTT